MRRSVWTNSWIARNSGDVYKRQVKGSAEPNRNKVGKVTRKQVEEIAKTKLKDLNTDDLEMAKLQVAGTARSMGISVAG